MDNMHFTPDQLGFLREQLGLLDRESMKKSLTGFGGYNLIPPVILLQPWVAPFRASLPTTKPIQGADQATWKTQVGFGLDFSTAFGVAKGAVGPENVLSATSFQANFATHAIYGSVAQEDVDKAQGYDDALSIQSTSNIGSIQHLDELVCLAGDYDGLATPANATSVAAGSGSYTSPAHYWVTALTMQGIIANSNGSVTTPASNNACVGESIALQITPNPASSGATAYDLVSWPYVPGALGYKLYAGANAGAAKLVPLSQMTYAADGAPVTSSCGGCFIGMTSVRVVYNGSDPSAIAKVPPSANGSANPLTFNGAWAWCTKQNVYGVNFAPGTVAGATAPNVIDMQGAALTPQASGIAQFDTILYNSYVPWKAAPTRIITSPLGKAYVSNLLLSGGQYIYRQDLDSQGGFTGAFFADGYVNKYASSIPGMPSTIEIWGHPDWPDGNFAFIADRIPYATAREAQSFKLNVMRPYSYFPIAPTSRIYPFDVQFSETLQCHHPYIQGAIVGARVV